MKSLAVIQMPKKRKTPVEIPGYRFERYATYTSGSVTNEVAEYWHIKTDMEFVLIPAGTFWMPKKFNKPIEVQSISGGLLPGKEVYLEWYLIGRYPVTNGQYAKFILDGGYKRKEFWPFLHQPKIKEWEDSVGFYEGDYFVNLIEEENFINFNEKDYFIKKANYPIKHINWIECNAFCRWAGLGLPSWGQWVKAAMGTKDQRLFPWGDTPIQLSSECDETMSHYRPVGSDPENISPYGCMDMLSAIFEWSSDLIVWDSEIWDEIMDKCCNVYGGLSRFTYGEMRHMFYSGHGNVLRQYNDCGFRCVGEIP